MDVPPDLASLSLGQIAALAADAKLPPVATWNPTHCGDSEMRIARDGTWFHQGSPIGRQEMIRLFSTILRREPDGGFVLVTPVEKLDIAVEDAPFVAVEVRSEGTGQDRQLAFRLNTGDLVVADDAHPMSLRQGEDGPRPYLAVRDGLEALIVRSVYYELVNLALDEVSDDSGVPVLWSRGTCFALTPPGEMPMVPTA